METPGTLHGATTVFLRWRFTVTVTTKKCLTRQTQWLPQPIYCMNTRSHFPL